MSEYKFVPVNHVFPYSDNDSIGTNERRRSEDTPKENNENVVYLIYTSIPTKLSCVCHMLQYPSEETRSFEEEATSFCKRYSIRNEVS